MDGTLSTMHFTDMYEDPMEDQDMMKRHCLLEVLDYLGILEYTRGYDGVYYMVTLKRIK